MKILTITKYLGNLGGLGRYSSEVVKAERALGLSVTVLSENQGSSSPNEHGCLKSVFNQPRLIAIINFLFNLYYARKFARHANIIHAHDGWPYAVYGWFAVIGTDKKLFVTGIGTYTIAPLNKKTTGWILRKAYNKAEAIFCISNYVRNKLLESCPESNAVVVFMGTTNLTPASDSGAKDFIKEHNLVGKYPIVLTVGDIKHRKGQLDTLKALSLLKEEYPSFVYIIIGTDDDTLYVNSIKSYASENKLNENIRIISKMYDDRTLSLFYQTCTIFALNSNNEDEHFEGFGLSLLEAAQFGKPVVGSEECGIEDAIENGNNGYLSKQGNPPDIAQKVKKALNDIPRLSENSKKFYKRFSWEKTVGIYIASYYKSVKKP